MQPERRLRSRHPFHVSVGGVTMSEQPRAAGSSSEDITRPPELHARSALSIGAYRLLERLGEGGMGEVWLAEQTSPVRRRVALKVIKAGMDTAHVVARFEVERQALAMMDHPAIAKVFDAGATPQGRPYFVMEFVRGEPITAYCARERLSTRDRLGLFLHVCDGVQHAHQKGIIHRDLKPSNILVTLTDGNPVPKIIDFGLAKAIAQPLTERTLHTELGTLVGTPEYMSPEQAEMSGLDIDTRTDVYALGVVLYELLTGLLPFDAMALREKGLDELRRTVREVEPPRPSIRLASSGSSRSNGNMTRLSKELRGDLDWITMRALEKDRTRRYGSAAELAADVRRHLERLPVVASPPSVAYRVGKFVRRHQATVGAAAIIFFLLVAFAVTMTVEARRTALERDRANREASTARQVAEFLVGLFTVSDPGEARGNTLTAREILTKGSQQIQQGLRDQPEVQARLQSTIGTVYKSLGMYTEGRPLLEEALETQSRVLGRDSVATLVTLNELANLHYEAGRLKEAEPLFLEVIDRRRRLLGDEHPDTLRTQFNLGALYARQERWSDAEHTVMRTLETQRRVLGVEHTDTLASMNNLQSLFYIQRRYGEAAPIAQEVLTQFRRQFGNQHPSTLTAVHNLATIYDAVSRYEVAEPLYLEAVEGRRRVLGGSHQSTANSQLRLAGMYRRLRRFEESEALALAAFRTLDGTLGPSHPKRREAATELAALYEAWGKRDDAAKWRSVSAGTQ